jgi:hypothetical protein
MKLATFSKQKAAVATAPLRWLATCGIGLFVAATTHSTLPAQPIPVANPSFESQVVFPFIFPVDFRIDAWQKAPKPGYFTDTPELGWDQTVGLFNGTLQNPYSNLAGNQAAYLLSLPGAGIFQDNQSTDWNNSVSGLNATYQIGKSYQLTLGVFGKALVENFSTLQLNLYYRDGANQITVGTPTTITFDATTFNPGGPFTLIDYSVITPIVQAGDAWAGQNIGIRIDSVFGTGAGYWDLDNVRLTAVPEPTALSLLAVGISALGLRRTHARFQRQSLSA